MKNVLSDMETFKEFYYDKLEDAELFGCGDSVKFKYEDSGYELKYSVAGKSEFISSVSIYGDILKGKGILHVPVFGDVRVSCLSVCGVEHAVIEQIDEFVNLYMHKISENECNIQLRWAARIEMVGSGLVTSSNKSLCKMQYVLLTKMYYFANRKRVRNACLDLRLGKTVKPLFTEYTCVIESDKLSYIDRIMEAIEGGHINGSIKDDFTFRVINAISVDSNFNIVINLAECNKNVSFSIRDGTELLHYFGDFIIEFLNWLSGRQIDEFWRLRDAKN